ncbi:MAG: O-acetyl-ADP-ribose deacetylase [Propionibacteriaceae bacterium]|nr:O-acetyl-ADP-ribose deacetylase [Propionibacteriaceae bacterium]
MAGRASPVRAAAHRSGGSPSRTAAPTSARVARGGRLHSPRVDRDAPGARHTWLIDIEVIQGDITRQPVDAVVNAANSGMRGGGGVDGAIHAAGGPAILADCIRRFPDGLPTGRAGWTTAGDLPARWVIHVVGPIHGRGDRFQLESCYANALAVADELGAKSIAFPLVSAGAYGWPLEDAARVAVDTVRASRSQVERCLLVGFSRQTTAVLRQALSRE